MLHASESMIEQVAQVHALDQDSIWLDTVRLSTCNSCSMKTGCGQRLMNQATNCKRSRIQLANPTHLKLQVGDEVVLGVPQKAFIKASLLTFAMPLMMMLLAAIGAELLGAAEPLVVIFAIVGLGLGLAFLRYYSRAMTASSNGQVSHQWQPVILRQQHLDGVQELHFNK